QGREIKPFSVRVNGPEYISAGVVGDDFHINQSVEIGFREQVPACHAKNRTSGDRWFQLFGKIHKSRADGQTWRAHGIAEAVSRPENCTRNSSDDNERDDQAAGG